MNTPRMDERYADAVRRELIRTARERREVRSTGSTPALAPAAWSRHWRFGLAMLIALAVVVPGAVLALGGPGMRQAAPAATGGTTVATDPTLRRADPLAGAVRLDGILHAERRGSTVCYSISSILHGRTGAETAYFVFPPGYRAGDGLRLLAPNSEIVGSPGQRVIASVLAKPLSTSASGCPSGVTRGVLAIHVAAVSTTTAAPTPSPAATPAFAASVPTAHGCSANGSSVPAHAETARIADVDHDGRPDTEWATMLEGGTIEWGVRTASGAVLGTTSGFASGGERSISIGRLADDQVVALPSDGHTVPLYVLRNCVWVQPRQGRDIYQFATGWGDPGAIGARCIDGALYAIKKPSWKSTGTRIDATLVRIAPDGTSATNGPTTTVNLALKDQEGSEACPPSVRLLPTSTG